MTEPDVPASPLSEAAPQPRRRPLLGLLVAVVATLVVGALLGVLWWRLAPADPLFVAGGKAYPQAFQPRDYIIDDGIAAILCLAAGLVGGIAAVVATRPRRLVALWSSVLLGALGAAVFWYVGTHLGAVDVAGLLVGATDGAKFDAPLRLRMPGVLVLWPAASAGVVLIVACADWWEARGSHA